MNKNICVLIIRFRQLKCRSPYRTLVGKSERKRPLKTSGHRCEDNIKMDLRKKEWDGVYLLFWPMLRISGGLL
jgi:hypothetical protein